MNPFTKKLIFFMLNHVNSRSHIIEIHQHGFFFLELTTNLLIFNLLSPPPPQCYNVLNFNNTINFNIANK